MYLSKMRLVSITCILLSFIIIYMTDYLCFTPAFFLSITYHRSFKSFLPSSSTLELKGNNSSLKQPIKSSFFFTLKKTTTGKEHNFNLKNQLKNMIHMVFAPHLILLPSKKGSKDIERSFVTIY